MSCKKFPYDIVPVDKSVTDQYRDIVYTDLVQIGPKKYIGTQNFKKHVQKFYNFEARPDDVWLFGYFRSGTTLTQEIVWLIANDLNYEKAAQSVLDHRFPFLDEFMFRDEDLFHDVKDKAEGSIDLKNTLDTYDKLHLYTFENLKEKRFIKIHMPMSLCNPQIFESGCKVVYCARNPKDVIVSNYHIQRFFNKDINFESVFHPFINSLSPGTPYFEHVKEGWAKRNDKNFLFLFYEETNRDKRAAIIKIANFLEKKLTEEQIDKLLDHINIDNFRKNKSVNNDHFIDVGFANNIKENSFIRKGKTGGWKDYFTPELNVLADKWIEENLKGSDLKFPV